MGIQDFQVVSRLGLGAYGSVYKVIRKADGQTYAIKRVNLEGLNQKDLAMALNEIRLLASFQHPRIVRFYETFLEHAHLCVVMEFCGFQDLERKIRRYQKRQEWVDERVIWVYLVQTLEALQALHSLRILHRDIKPANILLDEEGSAKLGDLNVSKCMMDGNEVQTVIGTLPYMAPEIWSGKPYTYPADIYSLGCTLFELTALTPPFDGASPLHIRKAVLKRQFKATIPEDVYSQDLRDLIMILLHPIPEERLTAERLLALPQVVSRLYLVRHKLPTNLSPPTPVLPSSMIDEATITLADLPLLLPTLLPGPTYPIIPPPSPTTSEEEEKEQQEEEEAEEQEEEEEELEEYLANRRTITPIKRDSSSSCIDRRTITSIGRSSSSSRASRPQMAPLVSPSSPARGFSSSSSPSSSPSSNGSDTTKSSRPTSRRVRSVPRASVVPITVDASQLLHRKFNESGRRSNLSDTGKGGRIDEEDEEDDEHSNLRALLRSPFAESASSSMRLRRQQQQQQQAQQQDQGQEESSPSPSPPPPPSPSSSSSFPPSSSSHRQPQQEVLLPPISFPLLSPPSSSSLAPPPPPPSSSVPSPSEAKIGVIVKAMIDIEEQQEILVEIDPTTPTHATSNTSRVTTSNNSTTVSTITTTTSTRVTTGSKELRGGRVDKKEEEEQQQEKGGEEERRRRSSIAKEGGRGVGGSKKKRPPGFDMTKTDRLPSNHEEQFPSSSSVTPSTDESNWEELPLPSPSMVPALPSPSPASPFAPPCSPEEKDV